jgi:hypothetical protein
VTLNKFSFDNHDTNYSIRNIPHMHHLRIQNTIGMIKRGRMVCHKWCTRFDIRKPRNNDHEIYPLHKTQCSPYFSFRNSKLTGRQWKPILPGEMPIPVPNKNLAASPTPTIHVCHYWRNDTVFQHKLTVWFRHTSRTMQHTIYCQPAEFHMEGEQDFPKERNQ